MRLIFDQRKEIGNEEIYRVSNFNCIYEADLFEDDSLNIESLNDVFKNTLKKFIFHLDESERENFQKEMQTESIGYKVFNFGRKNIFIVIDSISIEKVPYIINLFYNISIENTVAIICLGEEITFEFEKIKGNKITEYLFGECWIPKCTLAPLSACAFIRYDGALLTIVSNDFLIGEQSDCMF
ncbi:hypothetical protein SAMN04488168_13137 [Bacillus sp. 491mf]|uniref:hypothetical protein n=1 Tax=Bacillus sp. 491mf TaxID=1761755 RepID=UPI0008EFFF1F|nr:hypothetical protein [Bacillus sp. 491mf]SFD31082.1 hypothetical protein SAMN04488168_13137 [Bacillus sp. 491mf]